MASNSIIIALLYCLMLFGLPAAAAEIKCVGQTMGEEMIQRKLFDKFEKITLCQYAEISGRIEVGDFGKIEEFIVDRTERISSKYFGNKLYKISLLSSGGNIFEAMKIGRFVRKQFLLTSAIPHSTAEPTKANAPNCGINGKPVCCASACALIYFGGNQWFVFDYLGLHRPQLEDLGEYEYSVAAEQTKKGIEAIKAYLDEMEVDEKVFAAMMATPPNKITVWQIDPDPNLRDGDVYRYPTTFHDWLFAKCRRAGDRPRWDCMAKEAWNEARKTSHEAPKEVQVDQKLAALTAGDLRDLLARNDLDLSEKYATQERLSNLRLEEDRRRIDAMGLCDVKEYIDRLFSSERKRPAEGESKTFDRALDRLEAITGDREPWSVKNKNPAACLNYNSRF